jgi:hypothetical protein
MHYKKYKFYINIISIITYCIPIFFIIAIISIILLIFNFLPIFINITFFSLFLIIFSIFVGMFAGNKIYKLKQKT